MSSPSPHAAPAPNPEAAPGRRHAGPLALFAAIAVALLWPAIARLGQVVPGAPTSDTYDHLWGYWWTFQELASGQLPVRTEISHWPDGGLLWFVDPLGALISLPFQAVLGAAAGYTLALTVQVWGGMAAAYAAAWGEVRERDPAVLAGVIFGASPYVLSLLHSGTVEYLALAPIPLAWIAMRRALAEGGRRPAALAAGAWAWATFGNFYYGAFLGLLLGVAVVGEHARGWRPTLERAAWVVGLWAAMCAPFLAVAAWTLTSPDAVVDSASAPGWSYHSLPATDLLTFLHPGDYYFPDGRDTGNLGIIHVNYVGWIAAALAIVGAYRVRSLRLPLLLVAIVAMGPTLAWHQEPVRIGPMNVPLPAALLYFPGSPFRFVHHPFRLVVLLGWLMGLAAAHATAGRPRLALGLAVGVLVEALFASPAVFPIPTAPATAPPLYATLRDDETVRGIFDFPPNHHVANRRYEMLQTVHGKKVPYGVNIFLPDAFAENHFVRTLMQCLRRPSLATISREGGKPLQAFLAKPVPTKVELGRQDLVAAGYDVVVLHREDLADTEAKCVAKAIGGEAERVEGELEVWRLGR